MRTSGSGVRDRTAPSCSTSFTGRATTTTRCCSTRTSTSRPRAVCRSCPGALRMEVRDRRGVVALGRIPEAEKYAALAAADALVLPSRFESLGIVLLESWQVGTPVLVRADNPVTAGQVARSGGGLAYRDAVGFGDALGRVIAAREALGAAGRAWVERESS